MFTRTRAGLKSIFCSDRRNAGYELELLRPVLVKLREKILFRWCCLASHRISATSRKSYFWDKFKLKQASLARRHRKSPSRRSFAASKLYSE